MSRKYNLKTDKRQPYTALTVDAITKLLKIEYPRV